LARKDQSDKQLPLKEQFNIYKKEIGKQYMDGLISDKEYEKLLHEKEIDLGLNAPVAKDAKEGPECPSCGALINGYDAECMICGVALEPTMDKKQAEKSPEELESEEIPPETIDKERVCGTCGAVVSNVDTICIVCGSMLGTLTVADELGEPTELDIPVDSPPKVEKSCPSCGAFVEADATECLICETPFEAIAAIVPIPDDKTLKVAEDAPAAIAEPEKSCPSCGAFVGADATECMICDVPLDAIAPVIPASAEMPPKIIEEISVPTEEEEMPEKIIPKTENVCAGCGAVLDDGAEECFICGAKIGQETLEEPITPAHKIRIEDVSPEPIPIDHDLPPIEEEIPKEAESPAPTEEPAPDIVLGENEIICPSCSCVIPADSDKCPECWNDLSLYVKCPACSLLTPIGEDTCRECFAPLEKAEPIITTIEDDTGILDLDIPAEVEITEELKEEMTFLETEEEQGKECLVCGAIFGPEDQLCPICGIEYGIEIEEPKIPETAWDGLMEVEVPPTIHTCPSCGVNVTGLEATDREIDEGKWFYRGLIAIFTGIFFTSFSIYARGVSAENASLGLNPPPTDVLLNILGWILVIVGGIFWLLSWKLHDEKTECPACGIETEPDMAMCINCGTELVEPENDEETDEEESVDEDLLPEQEESILDQYNLLSKKPLQYEMPSGEQPQEELPEDIASDLLDDETPLEVDEELEVPPPEIPKKPQQAKAAPPAPAAKAPEHFTHGEELPIEHEEHKKCPGCGIFVDLSDTVCPICDTEFAAPKSIPDKDIEVPSEEDEMANLGPTEPSMDNITVPKESASNKECPSCGASLEGGMKACPVCEYPLDS
jgi:RNA polymerase subunit RPABC4/transcription elongation factor Spt4